MENYTTKPLPVEVFSLGGETDIIMRRNIHKETRPATDEAQKGETVWACEEVQGRFPGRISRTEVEYDMDGWWAKCAAWRRSTPLPSPTLDERVSDVELMLADLIGGAM